MINLNCLLKNSSIKDSIKKNSVILRHQKRKKTAVISASKKVANISSYCRIYWNLCILSQSNKDKKIRGLFCTWKTCISSLHIRVWENCVRLRKNLTSCDSREAYIKLLKYSMNNLMCKWNIISGAAFNCYISVSLVDFPFKSRLISKICHFFGIFWKKTI